MPFPPPSTGGTVSSVAAADTSVVIGGTPTVSPTVRTNTLDVIAADHPPAADWSNNSKKITALANGTAATDAAAFGQVPTTGQIMARQTITADHAETSVNFGGSTDVFTNLSFTADGTSAYALIVGGPGISSTAPTASAIFVALNLDGTDSGYIVQINDVVSGDTYGFSVVADLGVLSAAAHTVNIRVFGTGTGTKTIYAGTGGTGTNRACAAYIVKVS